MVPLYDLGEGDTDSGDEPVTVRQRPLEPGPAYHAGWKASLVRTPNGEELILEGERYPSVGPIHDDLISHVRSSGHDRFTLILPEEPGRGISMSIPRDHSGETVPDALSRYMGLLCREISAAMYREEGEVSEPVRTFSILLLLNELLLFRQYRIHHPEEEEPGENSLIAALIRWSGSIRSRDAYDLNPIPVSGLMKSALKRKICGIPVPEGIRLSWIRPEIWADGYTHLCIPRRAIGKKTQGGEMGFPWEPDYELVIPRIRDLLSSLSGNESLFFPGAGTGALFSRVYPLLAGLSGPDSPLSRLIHLSETILASDRSPRFIAAFRYQVVLAALDHRFDDPALTGLPLQYPLMALDTAIRAGSAVYEEEVTREFISAGSSRHILARIHPLGIRTPAATRPGDIILIASAFQEPEPVPETGRYLTCRYPSYLPGIRTAALLADYPVGKDESVRMIILILPAIWLSGELYAGFRKTLRKGRLKLLLIPDPDCSFPPDATTMLVFAEDAGDLVEVRYPSSGSSGGFFIHRKDLPGEGGWKIRDPFLQKGITTMKTRGIPLSDYTLHGMYLPETGESVPGEAIRIGIRDGRLILGEMEAENLHLVIPGRDRYLEAVLGSKTLSWYWEKTQKSLDPADTLHCLRRLPIAPVDWYDPDEAGRAREIEKLSIRRDSLEKRIVYMHAVHDRKRLERQIATLSSRLETLVRLQYGLGWTELP